MKTLDISRVAELIESYQLDPNQEPVILTRKNKPLAVVLAVNGADHETVSLSLNPKFLVIMEESRRSLAREGGISSDEMRRRFGLKPAANRSRNSQANGAKAKGSRQRAKQRK